VDIEKRKEPNMIKVCVLVMEKKSGVTYTGFRDEQNFIRGLRWQAINVTYFGGLIQMEYVYKYQ